MTKITSLEIDIETYSDIDLAKCGVYKYAESPAFEILLFGVAINGGEVTVYDLAQGEELPMEILQALTDEAVTKWAFNASFERICISAWLRKNHSEVFHHAGGDYLNPSSWYCSMVGTAPYGGI